MDSLQKQVSTLSGKVDALYHIVEQLSSQISEVLPESASRTSHKVESPPFALSVGRYAFVGTTTLEPSFEHKDVLVETNYDNPTFQGYYETDMTPEIQIQRLTAQLTAAYNRIAALEEQLLAQRIH